MKGFWCFKIFVHNMGFYLKNMPSFQEAGSRKNTINIPLSNKFLNTLFLPFLYWISNKPDGNFNQNQQCFKWCKYKNTEKIPLPIKLSVLLCFFIMFFKSCIIYLLLKTSSPDPHCFICNALNTSLQITMRHRKY